MILTYPNHASDSSGVVYNLDRTSVKFDPKLSSAAVPIPSSTTSQTSDNVSASRSKASPTTLPMSNLHSNLLSVGDKNRPSAIPSNPTPSTITFAMNLTSTNNNISTKIKNSNNILIKEDDSPIASPSDGRLSFEKQNPLNQSPDATPSSHNTIQVHNRGRTQSLDSVGANLIDRYPFLSTAMNQEVANGSIGGIYD